MQSESKKLMSAARSKIKMTVGEKIFACFNALFMLFMVFVCIYPMLYVLFASLSSSTKLMAHRGPLYKPLGFTFNSYIMVLKYPMVLSSYGNTIFIVLAGVSVSMVLTILGGYFLSRKNVIFQKPIMIMIVITMFFGGGLIPFYLTVRAYGFDNSYMALIIPGAVSTFNMMIMRTGFMGIPSSLEESVEIDGGGPLTALVKVCVPLVIPTLAVLTLYYAVDRWNAWFYASVFLRDRNKYPLQLVLREILISNDTNIMTMGSNAADVESIAETAKYAVIVIATLPILCLYPFLQKYFVKGIMIGSVKG